VKNLYTGLIGNSLWLKLENPLQIYEYPFFLHPTLLVRMKGRVEFSCTAKCK